MPISMYHGSVPVFLQLLPATSTCLDKAQAFAESRKYDPTLLLSARLAPDMFPLTRQVQLACDFAKNSSARLMGVEAPRFEDNEKTFDELKARVARTLDYLGSASASAFEGAEGRDIKIPLRDQTLEMKGLPYLQNWALPNFFFHVVTAYAILRHNGVEIGKRDFLAD